MRKLATAAALALVCIGAAAGPAGAAPQKISWSPCFQKLGAFKCATVQVPLDYDNPNGTTISIALTRLPATDQAHRIGSLFLNPEGPGGSGVFEVVFGGPSLFTPEVRARAVLYLDTNCAQRAGRIVEHMSTANVARDLDVLRQAVGDSQLTYDGVSSGTLLGQTYANMFPGKVRAMIIDGVLDPIAWTTGSGDGSTVPFSARLHSDAGAQATLQQFFALCDAAGSNCAFAPNSAARFDALGEQLKAQPLEVVFPDGSTGEIDYSNLVGMTLSAMYDSSSWADFAGSLADLELQASEVTLGIRLQPYWHPGIAYIPKRGFPHYFNAIENFAPVACGDSDNPHDYSAWSTTGTTEEASYAPFGRIWTWVSSICAKWPFVDGDRYTGPFTHTTAHPVLVIGNLWDPATRYQGAVTASNLLPGARLLTVHGWGHTSLFLSACADEVQARYLVDLTLPPAGTVCNQDHVPFSGP